MSPSSEEHLRRLAEQSAVAEMPRRRGRGAIFAAAVVVLAAGGLAAWLGGSLLRDGVGGLAGPLDAPAERLMAWWLDQQAADLAAPGADASPVAFEVRPGEALAAVAARLEAEGLIRDAGAFRLLARVRGLDTQVQAGAFTLRRDMPAEEVLAALMVAAGESVTVTIPEGKRSEEVATLLANLHLVERAEFLRLVGEGALGAAYPAVADRPAGAGLEGYLFPDTYQVDPEAGAEGVLRVLLTTFEARVTPEIRSRAQASGLSLYEVVTLASIVEREAALAIERPKIARVFLNRLAAAPYILNADPTVQYALGFQPEANSWWKRPLYTVDLDVDSAYNTYRNPGLPPGPIASPGLASIEAVVDPEPGPWQYFVANDAACDGSHVFAETFEEHQRNIAQYQTGGCGP